MMISMALPLLLLLAYSMLGTKGKKLEDAKIVCLGAGAAGIASMEV